MMAHRVRFYTVPKVTSNGALLEATAKLVGGYTVTDGRGGWVDFNGALVEEPSSVLEVITETLAEAHLVEKWVHATARGAGEVAVLMTTETISSTMLDTSESENGL